MQGKLREKKSRPASSPEKNVLAHREKKYSYKRNNVDEKNWRSSEIPPPFPAHTHTHNFSNGVI